VSRLPAVIVALTILLACDDSGGGSTGPNISRNCGAISSITTGKGTLTAAGSVAQREYPGNPDT
jgi:hypothetical protein